MKRQDALPALIKNYNLTFQTIRNLSPDLVYRSIQSGKVDVVMAFSTDGKIEKFDLFPLQDDKSAFPPYDAGIVIRQVILDTYPTIKKVLEKLVGKITEEKMRQMNLAVDIEGRSPQEVATQFLRDLYGKENEKN